MKPNLWPKKTWKLSLQTSEGSMASYVQPILQRIGCSVPPFFVGAKFLRSPKLLIGTEGFQEVPFFGGMKVVFLVSNSKKNIDIRFGKTHPLIVQQNRLTLFTELVGYSIKHEVLVRLRWWSPNFFSSTLLPLIPKRKKNKGEKEKLQTTLFQTICFRLFPPSIHHPSILLQQPWRLPNLTRDDWQNCRDWSDGVGRTMRHVWIPNEEQRSNFDMEGFGAFALEKFPKGRPLPPVSK